VSIYVGVLVQFVIIEWILITVLVIKTMEHISILVIQKNKQKVL